ncbi:MAG: Gfo/Idh/MocA family oxidoreductase [Pirellulaceae bacterium]
MQALNTESGPIRLTAMGNAFADRVQTAFRAIKSQHGDKCDVAEENRFVGFDAYQKVLLASDIDMVILATPPGFRPLHLEAAVEAGKHIFMEKPVAVDAPGVRRVLAASERPRKGSLRRLRSATTPRGGLQGNDPAVARWRDWRHQLTGAYWNGGGVWVRPRQRRSNRARVSDALVLLQLALR